VSDSLAVEAHKKRVAFKLRLQMIALAAAIVGVICFAIVIQGHVQSAILGGIGIGGLVVGLIFLVWARVYSFIVIAKRPTPPNLR
jgi:hypothetical protein